MTFDDFVRLANPTEPALWATNIIDDNLTIKQNKTNKTIIFYRHANIQRT
jgi:hypothetical protein